ncbi:hypothetical protein F4810DRAFT_353956 [Camillea tinctor]|nr:hypothetical protein F4810DRAFT_353956 [Camillea tinctor]
MDSTIQYSYSNTHFSYSDPQMSNQDNTSRADDGAQSYALKEYLHAKPTIVEKCSGAISDGQGKKKGKKGKEKHHEKKAKEELKKFDAAWKAASK